MFQASGRCCCSSKESWQNSGENTHLPNVWYSEVKFLQEVFPLYSIWDEIFLNGLNGLNWCKWFAPKNVLGSTAASWRPYDDPRGMTSWEPLSFTSSCWYQPQQLGNVGEGVVVVGRNDGKFEKKNSQPLCAASSLSAPSTLDSNAWSSKKTNTGRKW